MAKLREAAVCDWNSQLGILTLDFGPPNRYPSFKNMKTSERTALQVRTFKILKSIPKWELHHLASEKGLKLEHYNTHSKRAAGLTVEFYKEEGLTEGAKKIMNRAFRG